MILVGGLGLMAITTFLQGFVVRGTALRRRLDRGQTLDEFGVGGVGTTFRGIALTAAVMILLGAIVLYFFGFTDLPRGGGRLWAALFHSISAYNNAGFGLWSDSLERYRTNGVVNAVVLVLIVLGGLGWRVTNDLWINRRRLQRRNLSLHTRLVLRASLLLIAIGTLGLLVTESLTQGQLLTKLAWPERLMSALFESVSARTAGFTTVHLSLLSVSDSGLLLLMTLMFIGASPGGTGGGVKTTTVVALMAATRSTLRGREEVVIRNRQIPDKVVLRAVSITVASLLFVLAMALLLALSSNLKGDEPFTFLELLFTCISAFATVGQRRFQLGARHDRVDEAVVLQVFGSLEIFRQFFPQGLFDHAPTGKANQGFWFGQDQIPQHCETGCDAAGGGVGEQWHVKQPLLAMAFQRSGNLGHLHEAEHPLLHAGAT